MSTQLETTYWKLMQRRSRLLNILKLLLPNGLLETAKKAIDEDEENLAVAAELENKYLQLGKHLWQEFQRDNPPPGSSNSTSIVQAEVEPPAHVTQSIKPPPEPVNATVQTEAEPPANASRGQPLCRRCKQVCHIPAPKVRERFKLHDVEIILEVILDLIRRPNVKPHLVLDLARQKDWKEYYHRGFNLYADIENKTYVRCGPNYRPFASLSYRKHFYRLMDVEVERIFDKFGNTLDKYDHPVREKFTAFHEVWKADFLGNKRVKKSTLGELEYCVENGIYDHEEIPRINPLYGFPTEVIPMDL